MWHAAGADAGPAAPTFGVVAQEFWTIGATVPDADVLMTTIPADAAPETVLDQLAVLH